jgi:hypothetical protein
MTEGRKGAVSVPQSDPEDYTFWFVSLVGQDPRGKRLWKAGAKTKWNRVRSGRKPEEFE